MRHGILVSLNVALLAFGVEAVKVAQEAAEQQVGSDLSFLTSSNTESTSSSEPSASQQGSDLSAIFAAQAEPAAAAPAVEASAPEEEKEQISTALFDLNADELATLMALEDELYKDEDIDDETLDQLEKEMAAIEQQLISDSAVDGEGELDDLDDPIADEVDDEFADEFDIDEDFEDEFDKLEELNAESEASEKKIENVTPAFAGMKVFCADTTSAYQTQISEQKATLADSKALSDSMAQALSDLDPNMDNANEGKAFIRKMQKLRGNKAAPVTSSFPDTPEPCVEIVAGKVIQIEDLDEQISEANNFSDFFAHIYCAAYVNSLVTMKDGLQQIFPGGLDKSISDEVQRLYGPLDEGSAELDAIEIASVEAYFDALQTGLWTTDESSLIQVGEPVSGALALCADNISEDISLARQDRDDYINDLNFLNYLKSL